MAQRLRYTGDPPITPEEVATQARTTLVALELALVRDVIIPAVTAQCESITGAAIRLAEYQQAYLPDKAGACWLDHGQVRNIIAVTATDGTVIDPDDYRVIHTQRESAVQPIGLSVGFDRVTYEAGVDLQAYPGVKAWLLMAAATLYGQRELLITGTIVASVPASFIDHMLAEITVPPRF